MATNYDALISRDFHAKAFERANGSPSGKVRVIVKEGSPSSYCKARNDAGNRVEGGKMDRELARIEASARKVQKSQPQYVVRQKDGTLRPAGKNAPKRKRQYFHQTDVKTNHYRFNAGGIVDVYATNKKEAYAKFKEATGMDRVPARALMFVNGKAVQ